MSQSDFISNFIFNSPLGAFSRVGPPTLLEFYQRRLHIARLEMMLIKHFYSLP
ncbi:TPA: hypothetical protein ACGG71_001555 [Vibrio cholerae]